MNNKDYKRIQELKTLIAKYDKQYYEEGVSEISDAEYDRLYDEYLSFEDKYPELKSIEDAPTKRVGAGSLASSGLPKYTHKSPLLSINRKSKELEDLKAFYESVGGEGTEVIIEPKLDGITCNINYEHGKFVNAATRGNGYIGDLITQNFQNTLTTYPKSLPDDSHLELRGEAIIPYDFFKENLSKTYSNPRNAVAGLMRSLDANDVKNKGIQVMFYDVGTYSHLAFNNKDSDNVDFIKLLGFDSIPVIKVNSWDRLKMVVETKIDNMIKEIDGFNVLHSQPLMYPQAVCDGLVIKVNDLKKREALGMTEKGPRWAFAYKFKPLQAQTRIDHVEWQVGKNGTIVPVAVFDEISLGGVKITRATLNNYEYMKKLPTLYKRRDVWIIESYDNWGQRVDIPLNKPIERVEYLQEGDILIDTKYETAQGESNCRKIIVGKTVRDTQHNNDGFYIKEPAEYNGEWYPFEKERYFLCDTQKLQSNDIIVVERSNDVIPRIVAIHHHQSLSPDDDKDKSFHAPKTCPICGHPVEVKTPLIFCQNPHCSARRLGQFEQFVSRDGMNIIGLGSSILEEFLSKGFIRNFSDIYRLQEYKNDILKIENFGEKKYNNLIKSIQSSQTPTLAHFIYALGIPLVGKKTAKDIAKFYQSMDNFIKSQTTSPDDSLKDIEDIGEKTMMSIQSYITENQAVIQDLLRYVTPENDLQESLETLKGKTFVITGTLKNPRKYYQDLIESLGGKVSGSVSKRTYGVLIGEDAGSKEEKAKKLVKEGADILILEGDNAIQRFFDEL